MRRLAGALVAGGLVAGCQAGVGEVGGAQSGASVTQAEVQTVTQGGLPSGVRPELHLGLFEDTGKTWMRDSGVPWHVRYRYFTKGWADNFGWGARDGAFARRFFDESRAQGFVPAVAYYQMNGEPGGGEDQFYAKAQSAQVMRSYFEDFKLLLQRAKEFGQPVWLLMEADGYAYLQRASRENPGAYAAVAATGMPELAGLPNSVAGWGLAFLQLRKAVGASNVLLGMHISAWATDIDIMHSPERALQPEVDRVYAFLRPMGLGPNATGATYDFLVGDPLDRDADYYRVVRGKDVWWDARDEAPVGSRSFNRYAEWLRAWNQTSGLRWVLWQIPLGNAYHRNVSNDGTQRAGYRDNKTEYFLGPQGRAHSARFVEAGVLALLFGHGATGQATHLNDFGPDGQPYVKVRGAVYYREGALPLPGGVAPPAPPPPPTAPPPAAPPPSDSAAYHFEGVTQGWLAASAVASVGASASKAFAGTGALSVRVQASAAQSTRVYVPAPRVPAGRSVTFHVWVPEGARLASIQPYALQGASGGWRWSGAWRSGSQLELGAWNTVVVTVPPSARALHELGVEFATAGPWSGELFVDAVDW